MFWLDDAMIINNCYNSTEPNVGLKLNMERTTLKCYMADTGLLISHAFDENSIVSEEVYKKLLKKGGKIEQKTDDRDFFEFSLEEYKAHSDIFEEDLYNEISLETCVEKRISKGGTSVSSVEAQIEWVRKELSK